MRASNYTSKLENIWSFVVIMRVNIFGNKFQNEVSNLIVGWPGLLMSNIEISLFENTWGRG
jgi:hypothetical protein